MNTDGMVNFPSSYQWETDISPHVATMKTVHNQTGYTSCAHFLWGCLRIIEL